MRIKRIVSGYIVHSVVCVVLCSFALVAFGSGFNLSNRSPKSVMPVRASGRAGTDSNQPRTLAFAERVAYQRAIEEVYWRHRIWPKERPDPKPSLEAVISQAQLERKVQDYLRDSQALEDHWEKPITPHQLQAEMDRMAQHTKQPEVLREIFQALGDDPYVIAECLARPVLVQRLVKELNTEDRDHVRQAALVTTLRSVNYTLPVISSPSGVCIDDTWTPTSLTDVPAARTDHTAVWTGSEMIVWGGNGGTILLNTGGKYDPSTDSWTATSTTNAPVARVQNTAVWTGSEMIIWGGDNTNGYVNTGGRYNPPRTVGRPPAP
jgi:hypothetical protein